jgi:putative lipoprotein
MTSTESLIAGKTFTVAELGGVHLDNFTPTITFGADGSVHGKSVNNFSGTYSIEQNVLTIGPMATTRMMGIPQAQDIENALLSTLGLPLTVSATADGAVRLAGYANSLVLREGAESGLDDESEHDSVTVSGNVVYRQRIALPDNAVTIVSIVDVALADAPAPVLAREEINGGQVPIPFTLTLDLGSLAAHAMPSIGARIEADGQLLWITDMVTPVDTSVDSSDVTLNVIQVQHGEEF